MDAAAPTTRYRTEDGEPAVDVRISSLEQLFDNRDPAPFRQRDLDPGLATYLVEAAEDLAPHRRFRIVVWLDDGCPPGEIADAIRAHFAYELKQLTRRRVRQRNIGWAALAIAVASIVVLVALSEVVGTVVPGSLGAGLREALIVSGWVLMWRPVELLVYDGLPWRRERRVRRRILAMPIEVRVGTGPSRPGVDRAGAAS